MTVEPTNPSVVSQEDEELVRADPPQSTTPNAVCTQEQASPKVMEKPEPKKSPPKIITHARTLPNCRVTGIDYCVSVKDVIAEVVSIDEVKNTSLKPFDVFPIHWNHETYEISCHPEQSGDFTLHVGVKSVKEEIHIFDFKLTVIPDPKTLWKNIPSKQDGVYPKPDSDTLFLACDDKLSIVAASQRGRSHAQEGKPRDDDFLVHWDAETNCAILAVADGAGSAKFSRKGSQIAVQVALAKVKEELKPDFWAPVEQNRKKWQESEDLQAYKNIQIFLYKVLVQAAWEAKTCIKKEAEEFEKQVFANSAKQEQFTIRDYATTLILTIAKKLETGSWFVATFWVGDGGIGIYRANGQKLIVQGTPDSGEYGGQTRFLTEESTSVWPHGEDASSKIIERRLRFDVVDAFDAVILMTDGITDPKFETDSGLNLQTKWDDLWADLEKAVPFENRDESVAGALLQWMDFWSPGNHDDRTMVVLY